MKKWACQKWSRSPLVPAHYNILLMCSESPQIAGPDSVSASSQVTRCHTYAGHDRRTDLEIVDVGSRPESDANLSYQTLLTSDTELEFDLPTLGLSTSTTDIPLTGNVLDTGITAGPRPDPLTVGPVISSDPSYALAMGQIIDKEKN